VVLDSLKEGAPLATRRVAAVDAALPLNSLVIEAEGLAEADLAPVGDFERDPVAVAERLLGRPHALGARSSIETDCSGLVQQALLA
ncbi:C40 family peptidase, partial [Escherichia coli]